MNVLDLAKKDVVMKQASMTNGGEWQGPCPGCGGTDRFHVWPEQNNGRGGYWCRGCGTHGDNIQYLRDFRGKSFRDACLELGITPSGNAHETNVGSFSSFKPPQNRAAASPFSPFTHAPPSAIWQEHAEKLISWATNALMEDESTLTWLAARGISKKIAAEYRLGWNIGENGKDIYRPRKSWGLPESLKDDGRPKALWIPRGLVIPCVIDGVIHRIRIRRPEGEPRYYFLPGSSSATLVAKPDARAFVVVESELDAITVAACGAPVGAIALGSSAAKPDMRADGMLRRALQILNALDYDAAGQAAYEWWARQYERCVRYPVPEGKDPGDAVGRGIDLESWIMEGLPPALTLRASEPVAHHEPVVETRPPMIRHAEDSTAPLPPVLKELYDLLKANPRVTIINQPGRYTVLRDGKYVGGRINHLVFQAPEVMDYIATHPANEITGVNFIRHGKE